MSETQKAVFISYASQDAESARLLCEALRAAGVEVWFDRSELRGGDAWDQKIRRQIRECALFVPIVSANTQARREGYFRLEWKLADDRTHLMAKGTPFLLPVCVDETKDWDAIVPDSFMTVQWTRLAANPSNGLPADEAHRTFAERVRSLLTDGAIHHVAPATGATPARNRTGRAPSGASPGRARRVAALLSGILLVGVAVLVFWPRERTKAPAAAAATSAVAAAEFPRDPELRRAWDLFVLRVNSTAEDLGLAEEIVKAAIARRPTDPETVIVYAWLNDYYLNRGFDLSEERYVLARRYAERAVQLAPDEPEALAALGLFLSFRGADLARAEQLVRRAIELKPREPRFHRALGYNVLRFNRPEEALKVAERSAELFPNDPIVLYELVLAYRDAGRVDDMERAADRTIALAPTAGAVLWKAWIVGWVRGDIPGMTRWLDQVPANSRLSDRTLIVRHQTARLSQDPAALAHALRAIQAFPGATFRDFWFTGPKALLLGDLFLTEGKPELAKGQFELALTELARAKAAAPADPGVHMAECWAQLGLGRRTEAREALRLALGVRPPDFRPRVLNWWFNPIPAALLLGDRTVALQQLRLLADAPALRSQIRAAFQLDPRMAPFRGDSEILALIAEPKTSSVTP